MNRSKFQIGGNKALVEKIYSIKQDVLCRKIHGTEKLNHPISYWIKNDRLKNEIGKEFTIILRSRGCSWALSKQRGCSMCGYYLDANNDNVSTVQLINQFDQAYHDKINEIKKDPYNYIFKIFNSGSFLDEREIPKEVREYIFKKIASIEKFKEVIIESRLEYITSERLEEIIEFFKKKYIEIAIGIETVDDYIRNNFINKGVLFDDFKHVLRRCKDYNIGVRAYLLLKPPFLNEQSAIDDCTNSIKSLVDLGVDSISINPVNVQKGTLVEYLWYQNRYRPPWFYSLFKCIKKSISKQDLKSVRLISDPSGAGTKRGIHNCLNRDCENSSRTILKNFVLSQNLDDLEQKEYECECIRKYQLQKNYS